MPIREEYPKDKDGNNLALLLQVNLKNIELDGYRKKGVLEIFTDSNVDYPCQYAIRYFDGGLALHFYNISKIPEKSYYKALGVVSIMNYKKTAYAIFRDKVNKNNIDEVLEEWNDFISHGNKKR